MSNVGTRNLSRDSLFVLSDLTVAGSSDVHRVKVRNLSEGGMMAEGAAPVQRGEKVSVELRNVGKVDGVVAWLQGNRFGIAFTDNIDPKQVRAPVGNSDIASPRFTRSVLDGARDPSTLRKI